MSGHSKWHSIKHKKAASDAKRGQLFTKLANGIAAAARAGGADPEANLRLKIAIDSAKAANLPKENIERAIKRGTGELAGVNIEEFALEAFGPGGVGLLIEIITDNRNRALAEVRNILSKNGGTLADQGSVMHLFEQQGVLRAELSELTTKIEEKIIKSGALDYDWQEEMLTVNTQRDNFKSVKDILETAGLTFVSAQLEFVAKTPLAINSETEQKLLALVEALDDNDDIANVATNAQDF